MGDELLTPTRIYVKPILAALEQHRAAITGLAHITGGGLVDNTIRILPPTCQLAIDRTAWEPLPVFQWLQKLGKVDTEEMFQVFNMGIGFVLIVRPRSANKLLETLNAHALGAKVIGEIRPAK